MSHSELKSMKTDNVVRLRPFVTKQRADLPYGLWSARTTALHLGVPAALVSQLQVLLWSCPQTGGFPACVTRDGFLGRSVASWQLRCVGRMALV